MLAACPAWLFCSPGVSPANGPCVRRPARSCPQRTLRKHDQELMAGACDVTGRQMCLHRRVNGGRVGRATATRPRSPERPSGRAGPERGPAECGPRGIPGAEVGGGWEPGPPLTFLLPLAWRMDHTLGLEPSRKPTGMWVSKEGPRLRVHVGGPALTPRVPEMGSRRPCWHHPGNPGPHGPGPRLLRDTSREHGEGCSLCLRIFP